MTFTAVGSLQSAENAVAATTTTFSLTPGSTSDFILVSLANNSQPASNVTSTKVAWTKLTADFSMTSTSPTMWINHWIGIPSATGADTVTVTYAASMGGNNSRFDAREFHSSLGNVALDGSPGTVNGAGTASWATLTPAGPGRLYWGWCEDSGSAVAGGTSGFVYEPDSHSNASGYCLSVSAAYTPVWGDSGMIAGLMVLLKEGAAASAPPTAVLIPPGLASPMAFRRQAFPAPAPLLVPGSDTGSGSDSAAISVSDADTGTAAESSLEGPQVQAYPLTPPGRMSPMAWQFQARPSGAPLEVPSQDTGTGAETGQVQPEDSDTGAGAESAQVAVSDSDAGSAAESSLEGPPVQAFPLTPPGRMSPMAFRFQAWPSQAPPLVPSGDTGTGTEGGGQVSPQDSDTGTGAEASAVQVADADTGSGAETSLEGPPVQSYPLIPPGFTSPMAFQRRTWPSQAPLLTPSGDSGSGAEGGTVQVPGSDTGTSSDTASVQVADSDAGTGADAASITVSDSDSGSGADSGQVLTSAVPGTVLVPPGFASPMAFRRRTAFVPAPSVAIIISDSDAGSGAEASQVSVLAAETGTGADPASVQVASPDAGTGADSASVTVSGAEAGTGTDSATVGITAPDTGSGADTSGLDVQGADSGAGADAGSATATVPGSDAGSGADSGTVPGTIPPGLGGTAIGGNTYGGSAVPGNLYGGSAQ